MSGETPAETPTEPQTGISVEPPIRRSNRAGVYGVLIVILLLAVVVVWFYNFNTSTPILTVYPSQGLVSADWSGYAVSSDLQSPKGFVTGVSGSWVVPEVALSYDSFSATWVGIGGQYDESLIQTGTEHYNYNGSVGYIAWYELLPADSVDLNMTVSPGDVMRASITLQDAATNTWVIEISDATNGQTFSRSVSYASSMLSAEWIVERPTVNNFLYPLADFSRITFSDCSATMSGRTGSITGFPHTAFSLQGRMSNNLVTLSDPTGGGISFTVDYLASR